MAIKVLERLAVPAASPPEPEGGAACLPLTFFDVPWLFTGPVERVFFYSYPHTVEQFRAALLPSLVSSLSASLRGFYPLLGRVRPYPGGGYEFCYSSAGGVEFTVAESDDDFEELSGSRPRDVGRLYSLVPGLPGATEEDGGFALAAVQVTVFAGRGLAVGVSIHHVACDDSSYMHFVKTWAAHCRVATGEDAAAVLPPPPFLDRAVVADPDGLAARTLDEMRQLAGNGPPPPPAGPPPPKLLIASFTLSRSCIDKLKQRVAAKDTAAAAKGGMARVHCSAFTVACAFAWACLARAEGGTKERAHLLFSVECRRRLAPPIPQEYLGNCLRPCFVEVGMRDLLAAADGVVSAATAIGAAIRALDDGVLAGADGWFHRILSLVPRRPMSVGGSPRYGVYETDFGHGLGRPRKVELVSIDKTPGTVSLSEEGSGEGGIEVGVVLPEAEMARFSSCFSDGLLQVL